MNWAGFIPAVLLVSLIPGASQLLGLSNAARFGVGRALIGVTARLAAFAILIALVAGLGAILAASATALGVIKWIGVVYLTWLGVTSLRRGLQPEVAGAPGATPPPDAGLRPVLTQEFLVALSNPKALLLFAALLPQFTDDSQGAVGVQIAILGAAYLVVEFLVGLLYVGVGGRLGATGVAARTRRRIEVGSGACFVAMAALLAVEEVA
jgi:threonine/homoserine/homoserine lactone efflux protein